MGHSTWFVVTRNDVSLFLFVQTLELVAPQRLPTLTELIVFFAVGSPDTRTTVEELSATVTVTLV
jgi:hypothetical protein